MKSVPLLLLLSTPLSAASLAVPPDVATARDTIRPAGLASHIRFLADDLLEGRETGSRGFEIAARYVASQFDALGLAPGGGDGSWFQRVHFRTGRINYPHCSFVLHDGIDDVRLNAMTDYILRPGLRIETDEITAPFVFAGYGISAPELGEDDYASIDVRGKIVVVISGAPARFPNDQRAYHSGGLVKSENAAARGAVGIITIRSNTDDARTSFERIAAQSELPSMRYLTAEGDVADSPQRIRANGLLNRAAAARLFVHAPKSLAEILNAAEKEPPRPFALNISATIHTAATLSVADSENVAAILPGSDPARRDQYVVISAHLDHLGDRGTTEDRIYNGAYDNASGSAALLEIARAFAALPQAPARSILFVALTGEEKGEQGSEYIAAHPPLERGSIVADINMDMFLMLFPTKDVILLGAEHTSLGPLAQAAAETMGFEVNPDPMPEEVRFIRSDQYSFVKSGIPSISIKTGIHSSDPAIDGDKVTREWLRTIYHSVHDDMNQHFDWPTGVRYTQMNFLLAWSVANAVEKPRWIDGDFFGKRFGG